MNVVVCSADGVNENSVLFADAGGVGPEARLKILRDQLGAVFGAEDGVDCVLSVRVRHVPHLRRWAIVYLVDPARQKTAGWAKLWRAYSAGEWCGLGTRTWRRSAQKPAGKRRTIANLKFQSEAGTRKTGRRDARSPKAWRTPTASPPKGWRTFCAAKSSNIHRPDPLRCTFPHAMLALED